jgi:hypothetical protein
MSSTVPENLRRLMDIIDENKEALPEGAYLEVGRLIMAQQRTMQQAPIMSRDGLLSIIEHDLLEFDMLKILLDDLTSKWSNDNNYYSEDDHKFFTRRFNDCFQRERAFVWMRERDLASFNLNQYFTRTHNMEYLFDTRGWKFSRILYMKNMIQISLDHLVSIDILNYV